MTYDGFTEISIGEPNTDRLIHEEYVRIRIPDSSKYTGPSVAFVIRHGPIFIILAFSSD